MRLVKHTLLVILALLLMTVLSSSIMAEEMAEEQILRVGSGVADAGTIDPHFATTFGEYPIVKSMFNGLVDFPAGSVDLQEIQGDLAKSWEVDEEGLTWIFNLREGVQFHHGYGELTSEDVVFSFYRVKDPEVGSPWRASLDNFKEINALDRYTVEIKLENPDPFTLLRLVGYQAGFIVSKKAVEELGDDFRFNPIGTGPFVFESYEPREKVVVTRNEDFFKKTAYLDSIEFLFMPDTSSRELALRTGEVHTADGVSEQVWYDRIEGIGLKVEAIGPGNNYHLHYNMSVEPFDDIRVRQALNYAINRREIVEDFVGAGIARVADSPVPLDYYGHTNEGVPQYEYDPEMTQKLLEEAGYPNGFSFEIYISEATSYLPFAQIVQEQWRRVGVDMQLNVVDHSSFHSLIRDNASPVVFYNAGRLPIADVYLSQFYHSNAVIGKPTAITNFSHFGELTSGIDHLIEEARYEMDTDRQLDLYRVAQQRIMEEAASYHYMQRMSLNARQPYVDLGYSEPVNILWAHFIYNENTRILKN